MTLFLLVELYTSAILSYFNIILGMNQLRTYGAKIDCKDFKVILNDEKG